MTSGRFLDSSEPPFPDLQTGTVVGTWRARCESWRRCCLQGAWCRAYTCINPTVAVTALLPAQGPSARRWAHILSFWAQTPNAVVPLSPRTMYTCLRLTLFGISDSNSPQISLVSPVAYHIICRIFSFGRTAWFWKENMVSYILGMGGQKSFWKFTRRYNL